jgi:methionine-rich copper-binding protein CopC
MKNIRKGFGIAAAAGLIVLIAAAPALAHPKVVSRTPEDGSTVDQPPSQVSVEFDEAVTNADLDVFDPCGDQVDNGSPEARLYTVSVGMSADKAGTYTVQWEVISEDSHNVSGSWTFTSSGGSACPGSGGGDGNGNGGNTGGTGGDQPGGGGDGDGDGGNTQTTTGSGGDSTSSSDGSGDGTGKAGTGGKHQHHNGNDKKNDKKSKHDHPTTDEPREVDLVSGGDEGGRSDMPVDWLLISFGIAALIGAAGGSIYASIVGPR